jgi:hypothetical protein
MRLSSETSFHGTSMEEYYRERAAEYDAIYRVPDRQEDLVRLRSWLTNGISHVDL